MELAKTIKSVRSLVNVARSKGKKIGLVPTMGALHIGHISLIEAARKNTDFVVVSIFVNPTQFGPGEDFEKYPRPLNADFEICKKAGTDVVFAPSAKEMYPAEKLTWVNVERLTQPLCGRSRPGHFRGVATVCTKLFNIVVPDIAFFGQKDAQQAAVVKKMVTVLNMSLEIVVCPTVREKNGLAVSSRNRYLTAQERKDAASIYKSLRKCEQMVKEGTLETEPIIAQMRKILSPVSAIEYISIVDARTLETIDKIAGPAIAAVAVKIGSTRLIDNILIGENL